MSERLDAAALGEAGFSCAGGPFPTPGEAFAAAEAVVAAAAAGERLPAPAIIGDFVVPPAGGPPSRDFQTLHFDFGLPLDPRSAGDVARYTALHVDAGSPRTDAVTRLVPLAALLEQRTWPAHAELLRRFAAYGETHGAWDHTAGYAEGSLARLVEAAAGDAPALPSVKAVPGFLCGHEFASLGEELEFLGGHGLSVADVQVEITLEPGALVIFDNLVLAHGRRGTRRPGELRQRVFGHRALDPSHQRELRDRALAAFSVSARAPAGAERRR